MCRRRQPVDRNRARQGRARAGALRRLPRESRRGSPRSGGSRSARRGRERRLDDLSLALGERLQPGVVDGRARRSAAVGSAPLPVAQDGACMPGTRQMPSVQHPIRLRVGCTLPSEGDRAPVPARTCQVHVNRRDHLRALADCRRDALDRPRTHVADREDSVPARFQSPATRRDVLARPHEAFRVERHARPVQARRVRVRSDEAEPSTFASPAMRSTR